LSKRERSDDYTEPWGVPPNEVPETLRKRVCEKCKCPVHVGVCGNYIERNGIEDTCMCNVRLEKPVRPTQHMLRVRDWWQRYEAAEAQWLHRIGRYLV
jgi:hypothetical protein